ncbi:beta-hexosaminidase [Vagococcus vulneris]|uniref:beta-N-acetylhexosaminidase n=2 Tax=Vagococcus vulneris TaxID=1977869 RepID=A0A429ZUQ7_9ENTE|nr:beta-hexosaminidase [Vagococcus vulneris]
MFICLFVLLITFFLVICGSHQMDKTSYQVHLSEDKPNPECIRKSADMTSKKATQLKDTLNKMTVDEKIGQLFLARVPEKNALVDIKTYHLGGYLLFGRDVAGETTDSLKKKIVSYQSASRIPLLIGSDEEGGTVSRLSQNSQIIQTPFKSPQDLYKSGGWEAIKQDTAVKSTIFKELGIHTGLFPVADVSTNSNSFIYDRTIGQDVVSTKKFVTVIVSELKDQQIGSTLKHFPGYGNSSDSHTAVIHDSRTLKELQTDALPPFQAGIDAGADSVLVAHNIFDNIDAHLPASLSKPIHQLLRDDLNFNGVIMTDDMDMAGITDFTSQSDAALKALEAGNDLILSSSYAEQIPTIKKALNSTESTLTEKQLDESVLRILAWKQSLGLIQQNTP